MCVWHTGWLVRLVSGVYVGPVLVEMPGGQLDAGVVADLAFWSQQCGTDFPPAPTDSELGCWGRVAPPRGTTLHPEGAGAALPEPAPAWLRGSPWPLETALRLSRLLRGL